MTRREPLKGKKSMKIHSKEETGIHEKHSKGREKIDRPTSKAAGNIRPSKAGVGATVQKSAVTVVPVTAAAGPFMAYPFIRLISFSDFLRLGSFPRYPENKDITVSLSSFTYDMYDNSLFVFISHCWLRGWSGAEGWDGRPHPDNATGGKYQLCIEGISMILQTLTVGMKECYLWLDFGCIDQDGNPAGELKMLDIIVQVCDCIFTPIVDTNHKSWNITTTTGSWYEDYKSIAWRGTPYSYLNRGWCRIEMFYGSNIPLFQDTEIRRRKFRAGLLYHRQEGRRPHILFGTKQQAVRYGLIILPPLQNSFLDKYNPIEGYVSVATDKLKIASLVESLTPYMSRRKDGYEGQLLQGKKHGQGKYFFTDGSIYEGQWENDHMSGKGRYTYADGSVYIGEWKSGNMHGYGKYIYADGDIYQGEYQHGMMHGKGKNICADGDMYGGEYKNGNIDGYGIYSFADGSIYDGEWKKGLKHGKGKYTFADGSIYEGEYRNGQMDGYGRYSSFDGSIYEGKYRQGKRHGKGILKSLDGNIYEGDWKDGQRHGKGKNQLADGSCYIGEYINGKRHGKGKFINAEGRIYQQQYKDGVLLSEIHIDSNQQNMCVIC